MPIVFGQGRPEVGQPGVLVVQAGGRRLRGACGMADPSGDTPGVAGASLPGSTGRGGTVQVRPEYRPRHGACRSGHPVQRVKTMKRMAYGFRDPGFFKLKILAIHETRYALVG